MSITYLSLGTNLGDRLGNLRKTITAMPAAAGNDLRVVAESGIYETPPWGYEQQPEYLNMAVKAETVLEPEALLAYVKVLEHDMGRVETFRWGPRLIDIDILFYDNLVVERSGLVIPHPRLQERAFVLVPLADIAREVLHPVLHKTVGELLAAVDVSQIKPYTETAG